jgi:hypothetical protein
MTTVSCVLSLQVLAGLVIKAWPHSSGNVTQPQSAADALVNR